MILFTSTSKLPGLEASILYQKLQELGYSHVL